MNSDLCVLLSYREFLGFPEGVVSSLGRTFREGRESSVGLPNTNRPSLPTSSGTVNKVGSGEIVFVSTYKTVGDLLRRENSDFLSGSFVPLGHVVN